MIVCGLILAVVTISILYILIRYRWPDDLRAAAKGTAVGAFPGAAAGAGADVITRGFVLRMPSETSLRFRLDQHVYLYR